MAGLRHTIANQQGWPCEYLIEVTKMKMISSYANIPTSQLKYLRMNLDSNGNPLVDNFRPTQDNGNTLYHYEY